MERRELLKMIAVITGAAVVGGEAFLSGCAPAYKAGFFSAKDLRLLNEIGETILPASNTPGAKEADVASFMETIVSDCYTKEEQIVFANGLIALEKTCNEMNGTGFMKATAEQRKKLLLQLEPKANTYNEKIDKQDAPRLVALKKQHKEYDFVGAPKHYYTMIKQLTLLGYFTSEVGQKKALRLLPVPGKYDGAYPYKKGDKAWA